MRKAAGGLEIGSKINYLTITGRVIRGKRPEWYWQCSCECGSSKVVFARNAQLLSGVIMSCGCYALKRKNTSGLLKGWETECVVCGAKYVSVSLKQNVCSTKCRFGMYEAKAGDDDCWEWKGPISNQGYGVLFLNQNKESGRRTVTSAHRYAYAKYREEPQAGLCVMHVCDNRKCTNPTHLTLGTWADNNKDRSLKGRSGTKVYSPEEKERYGVMFRGEGNANSKLTDETAKAIKYQHADISNAKVAKMYGVSKCVAQSIRVGKAWKHI